MEKTLVVDAEKCTGCRTCEVVCSFYHERECNPSKSRIHVIKWEEAGLDIPMVCQQCELPVCAKVCPVKAISRNTETGALEINYDLCIGCRMCFLACPFGAITLDKETKRVLKCDLCGGDPKCTTYCSAEAIEFMHTSKATLIMKRKSAQKFGELMRALLKD